MAYFIDLPTYSDPRGKLTVADRILPFEIKRVYYIYEASQKRGGHRHKKAIQALICLKGSCEIYTHDGLKEQTYTLNDPAKCLIMETKDWHTMDRFTHDAVLLVLSSEHYSVDDYIDEPYA